MIRYCNGEIIENKHMPKVKRKKKSKDWINVMESATVWKVSWDIMGWESINKQERIKNIQS